MAKKQIAPFLGTQKGLSVVKEHCFAYSGPIIAAGSPGTDYLDFHTGNFYIVARIQWFYLAAASNDLNYRHYLNEIKVIDYLVSDSPGNSEPDNWIPLIIPPRTRYRCNALGSQQQMVVLTGRVYDA